MDSINLSDGREIIKTRWFTTNAGSIGIVLVLLHQTEQWRGYISSVPGVDQTADTIAVADYGAKLSEGETRGFFPDFEHEYTYKGS